VAYAAVLLERSRILRPLGRLLLLLAGYGSLLPTITAAAYVKELQHADMRWRRPRSRAIGQFA